MPWSHPSTALACRPRRALAVLGVGGVLLGTGLTPNSAGDLQSQIAAGRSAASALQSQIAADSAQIQRTGKDA